MAVEKDVVIVDLDGTLALDHHRNHFIHPTEPGKARDWDAYFDACGGDAPNRTIIELVQMLYDMGKMIFIMSGRIERMRVETKKWLVEHKVPYHVLMMRATQDRTQDTELKLQWVDLLDLRQRIWFVLEDRARVVESWRAAGFTCLQVAPGNF